jgi:hypothetical protein
MLTRERAKEMRRRRETVRRWEGVGRMGDVWSRLLRVPC